MVNANVAAGVRGRQRARVVRADPHAEHQSPVLRALGHEHERHLLARSTHEGRGGSNVTGPTYLFSDKTSVTNFKIFFPK